MFAPVWFIIPQIELSKYLPGGGAEGLYFDMVSTKYYQEMTTRWIKPAVNNVDLCYKCNPWQNNTIKAYSVLRFYLKEWASQSNIWCKLEGLLDQC